jgi:quercetin dioxygenase-like cupin family protein
MPVIKAAESRRTETPNAVMTTLASPTLGASRQSVWRVDMKPGQSGPLHGIDADQVWAVLDGAATVRLGTDQVAVEPGDTVVIPADVPRRITADALKGFAAVVTGPATLRAYVITEPGAGQEGAAVAAGETVAPPWVV